MKQKPLYLEPVQAQTAPPTEYENKLGDALEAAFADGIEALEPLVARLNDMGVRAPNGEAWTPDLFETEIKRLGA
jgi:hypothetical protein